MSFNVPTSARKIKKFIAICDALCSANVVDEQEGFQAALNLEPEVIAATFEMQKRVVITGGNDKVIKVCHKYSVNVHYSVNVGLARTV